MRTPLDRLTSPLLDGFGHGFFTRRGGASSGVFQGLNCGHGSTDQTDSVAMNRARVADDMGVAHDRLLGVHQVHSPDAVIVDEAYLANPPAEKPKADALVTTIPGVALSVLTADCMPVLLADPEAGVIAAAHAGWRGALEGVLETTIERMEHCGARRARIRAVIGPCITQGAYEVAEDFMDRFLAEDPGYARFFSGGPSDKPWFNLPGFGLHRLHHAGVGAAGFCGHCTYADAERFYSFRRATHRGEADYGRLISVIRI